jgi:hypothetical protein
MIIIDITVALEEELILVSGRETWQLAMVWTQK